MDEWIEYVPPGGWAAFAASVALTKALWSRLSSDEWHYLNFVVGSSVWESRRDGSSASVFYDGERIVELGAQGGAAGEIIGQLASEFGLVPAVPFDAEPSDAADPPGS